MAGRGARRWPCQLAQGSSPHCRDLTPAPPACLPSPLLPLSQKWGPMSHLPLAQEGMRHTLAALTDTVRLGLGGCSWAGWGRALHTANCEAPGVSAPAPVVLHRCRTLQHTLPPTPLPAKQAGALAADPGNARLAARLSEQWRGFRWAAAGLGAPLAPGGPPALHHSWFLALTIELPSNLIDLCSIFIPLQDRQRLLHAAEGRDLLPAGGCRCRPGPCTACCPFGPALPAPSL